MPTLVQNSLVLWSDFGGAASGDLIIGYDAAGAKVWASAYSALVQFGRDSSNPVADAAMDSYAEGDDSAFSELYDALAPRLQAYLLRKVRDPSRAEDLVQQTMLHVHCARGRFVRGSRVTPWVFAIATRLFLDLVRRKKLEVLSDDGDLPRDPVSDWPSPDVSTEHKQLGALVRAEVEQLSAPQKEAFELVYFAQMNHSEAAESLGVTVASVKLRLHRANRVIRDALNEGTREEPEEEMA